MEAPIEELDIIIQSQKYKLSIKPKVVKLWCQTHGETALSLVFQKNEIININI
jgi:hypothetical protein